ncbi:MAG: 2-dehydropantoate 2-reductase N-terminal domain-containing protein, partial [Pseudomonadota bacterium]
MTTVAVIGAGSWGTALAIQYARAGSEVRLWGRDSSQCQTMAADRCNQRYLPEGPFPTSLQIETELTRAIDGVDDILISVPSHALRETVELLAPMLAADSSISWATKGLELATGQLPHEVVTDV